jgi:putative N-acetylmannosamine-6-phosphate epimerase
MNSVIEAIRGGIIISCQAYPGEPTFGANFMAAFALGAKMGGAVGIRANTPVDVRAIKEATDLPVIGIWKREAQDEHKIIITPTFEDAKALKEAGAEIIALDVTRRPRPGGVTAEQLIQRIKHELGVLVMADCVSLEDAQRAEQAGADLAAPTLSFPEGLGPYDPNFPLLSQMVSAVKIPVIAEGRYWEPEQVRQAFEIGVLSVVIGSAVTRPWLITERFAKAAPRRMSGGATHGHA